MPETLIISSSKQEELRGSLGLNSDDLWWGVGGSERS